MAFGDAKYVHFRVKINIRFIIIVLIIDFTFIFGNNF